MDSVCLGINTPALGTTYINGDDERTVTYTPPTQHTYTVGTTTKTATLFSVLAIPAIATYRGTSAVGTGNRYAFTGLSGYWINPTAVTAAAAKSPPVTVTANSPDPLTPTDSTLTSVYTYLTVTNVPGSTYKMIDPNPSASVSGQVTQAKQSVSMDLLYSLKYEFCFWVKAYKVVLGDYITTANATSLTDAVKNGRTRQIINQLNSINLRLSDLTMIASHIGTQQSNAITGMNSTVNEYISSITSQTTTLQEQSNLLSSSDVKSKLRSRMLEYSDEKNAYANQLLATYGFANLIALGLLFYIYRS
jgi:hypothetical protein